MTEGPADDLGGQTHQGLFNDYVNARQTLLSAIGRPKSNREPLAEWAEWFAAKMLDGELAKNPVQAGYDMTLRDGTRVQIKYLANPSDGKWNWRFVEFPTNADVDLYALLVLEDLRPICLLVFHRKELGNLYEKLHKRHAGRGEKINFTKGDYRAIRDRQDEFRGLVDVAWPDDGNDHVKA